MFAYVCLEFLTSDGVQDLFVTHLCVFLVDLLQKNSSLRPVPKYTLQQSCAGHTFLFHLNNCCCIIVH